MDKLYFGTAGVPLSSKKRDTLAGINQIKGLGLGAMELEFVRNVRMGEDTAAKVGKLAKETGVTLSAHAPYYINLNADTEEKRAKSRRWILDAAHIGWLAGATSVVFHPASYEKMEPEKVYGIVKTQLQEIVNELRRQGNQIWVCPEITGKPSYFGSLEELLQLSLEIDGVIPCIDFAHLHARTGGKFNTYKEFISILDSVKKTLGREGLDEMRIHLSGIEYADKGERKHLNLQESDFNYKDLLRAFKDFDIRGIVICESPNLEEDALLLQREYLKLS